MKIASVKSRILHKKKEKEKKVIIFQKTEIIALELLYTHFLVNPPSFAVMFTLLLLL